MKLFTSMFLLTVMVAVGGCQTTIPKEALALTPTSLEDRQLQTREFETEDEELVMSAVAGVLQDLGFTIDDSETRLGYISGAKDRDATHPGQIAAAVIVALLGGGGMAVDKNQKMRAAVVVSVNPASQKVRVRVTFQRKVWNTANQITKAETLKEPEFYQEFYGKLSKSIFLEGHNI